MTGRAFRCEVCDTADRLWQVTRRGDVVTSWACGPHLPAVCDALQRGFEVTELAVISFAKLHEWAALSCALDQIADGQQ